jgi:DNA polymerase (family X)
MPDNEALAAQFELLAKLMELHGENAFKAKSYASTAFALEKLATPLESMDPALWAAQKGIGSSAISKINEILSTGKLQAIDTLVAATPPGVLEMLSIKGLGPKKVASIWKEMEIESLGELLYACQENRLLRYKGFGEKTQATVQANIHYYLKSKGSFLFADTVSCATQVLTTLKQQFADESFEWVGEYRRQLPVIMHLDLLSTMATATLQDFMTQQGFQPIPDSTPDPTCIGIDGIPIRLLHADPLHWEKIRFQHSASEEFYQGWVNAFGEVELVDSEVNLFKKVQLPVIPPALREKSTWIQKAKHFPFDKIIQPTDIKGMIHNHSTWSDGSHSIETMAQYCIDQGWEYLVISDHSKTAGYAQGLKEARILEQHIEIDALNAKLAPFKIFKSIESDILGDGALDYADEVLRSFDLVIASIHSNLYMTEEKAMMRLMRAIEHPYTTILGHMTGRLLLSRKGYPVNHQQIIDACAAHQVAIEINAHPRRLDMDWEWIEYALEKGVYLSIDPDAHHTDGFHDTRFGVWVAQKGGLTPDRNLSSFSRIELEQYLERVAKKRMA